MGTRPDYTTCTVHVIRYTYCGHTLHPLGKSAAHACTYSYSYQLAMMTGTVSPQLQLSHYWYMREDVR